MRLHQSPDTHSPNWTEITVPVVCWYPSPLWRCFGAPPPPAASVNGAAALRRVREPLPPSAPLGQACQSGLPAWHLPRSALPSQEGRLLLTPSPRQPRAGPHAGGGPPCSHPESPARAAVSMAAAGPPECFCICEAGPGPSLFDLRSLPHRPPDRGHTLLSHALSQSHCSFPFGTL